VIDIITSVHRPLGRLLGFMVRVLRRFFKDNKGFLLAGAVGYNTLLSVIPLFAVLIVGLSAFFDEQQILSALQVELRLLAPGQSELVTSALEAFMEARTAVGIVGFLVMLFFSSIAFRMLEEALSVIFKNHPKPEKRSTIFSLVLPYLYIGAMGMGLVILTAATGVLDAFEERTFSIFGSSYSTNLLEQLLMQGLGFVGLALILSSIYVVMPAAKIGIRRALVGGVTAAVLWEGISSVLVWYFENISLVNVVYGSLGAVIVILLSMELASFIILIGAQTIAELEDAEAAGVEWWEDPKTSFELSSEVHEEDPG